ncbi:MAG: hypothetical protein IPM49_14290 [Flavobacteriales bacterium]|nr:hypothetical protein [Flavobacteriales bacterium]
MNDHNRFTDDAFVAQFTNCTLAPALFTHEAHLRLGWIMVRSHGTERAGEVLCDMIARYARALGRAEKFNLTITIASTRMIAHFLARSSATDFASFIAEFSKLRSNFQDLLDAHYSGRVYASDLAATRFIEPDLRPF